MTTDLDSGHAPVRGRPVLPFVPLSVQYFRGSHAKSLRRAGRNSMTEIKHEVEDRILSREWFYRFRLPSGRVTRSYLSEEVLKIHDTREQMLLQFLEGRFGGRWGDLTCVDLACHEGYFSHKLALKGCREVLGIDARGEHVEHAGLIREAFGLENLSFRVGNIQRLESQQLGRFDVTLLFGVLYHLEDIVSVLRLAQAITTKVCLIETQVAPNLSGTIDWGSYRTKKNIMGCMVIIDETSELASGNMEANTSPISLVPSPEGLTWMLKKVGFKEVQTLPPPADAYEQLAGGERLIVAAHNDLS